MAQAKPKRLLRAKAGFVVPGNGKGKRGRAIKGGQEVYEDDPVVKGREHLFEPAEQVVEAATAAPGEKRRLRRAAVVAKGGK